MNCYICNQDHSHQLTDYPLGATVEVLGDFYGSVDTTEYKPLEDHYPRVLIPAGSFGTVMGHCEDGRAVIEFDAEIGKAPCGHTFHYPEGYFKLGQRPEPKQLTAEEASAAYRRFLQTSLNT